MNADLQALIDYSGLSMREAAAVIGCSHETLSRKLKGEARYDVRMDEIMAMREFAELQDKLVDMIVAAWERQKAEIETCTPEPKTVAELAEDAASRDPEFDWFASTNQITLISYRRDEDMIQGNPLHFASAWRMVAARVARQVPTDLVPWDERTYRAWLASREDNAEMRSQWAVTKSRYRLGIKLGYAKRDQGKDPGGGPLAIGWFAVERWPGGTAPGKLKGGSIPLK